MSFRSFGEFLRWAHAGNYSEQGMRATSAHNSIPYNPKDETDARILAKRNGNESNWPAYLEQIVLTNLRAPDGYDDSLEIDV